jgi:hypothetical protein
VHGRRSRQGRGVSSGYFGFGAPANMCLPRSSTSSTRRSMPAWPIQAEDSGRRCKRHRRRCQPLSWQVPSEIDWSVPERQTHKFGHGRKVRQRMRARDRAHRKRTKLAALMYSMEAGIVIYTCPARRSISGPVATILNMNHVARCGSMAVQIEPGGRVKKPVAWGQEPRGAVALISAKC